MAPVLATSSSEISVPKMTSSEITAPDLATLPHHACIDTKKNCTSFARYLAGFWLVRTTLGITESTLCLIEIIAQTLGTPLLEPLNSLRRTIRHVLDEPMESLASVIDEPVESETVKCTVLEEPVESLADAIVSTNMDRPFSSNNSPNSHISGEVENDKDAKNSVDHTDDNEDTKNLMDATDDPILKTEIRNSEREVVNDEVGPKTTEFEVCAGSVKEYKEASINPKNMEEFEEEALRKSFAEPVKDLQPIKLKTYEKRMDDIVEVESTSILSNFEEYNNEAIDTTDDFKIEDDTSDENSYAKGFSLDEPSTQSSFFQDQYYPLLLEHTFLGPPAPTPSSARRYPGFRHMFVYEPYQTRYGALGPVEDLVDDLIIRAVHLSSSRAISTFDDPAEYPLPDDSFDSSIESIEF